MRGEASESSAAARGVRRAERWLRAICRVALWGAAASCIGGFAVVCYAVAMRYFLGEPKPWTDEAVGWLMVVTVMLAVPEAQRRGENIGVDWLVDKWTGRRRRMVLGAGAVSVAAVAAVLVVEGWETVVFTRTIGIVSNALPQIPLWTVQAFIPLGGALLLLVAALEIAAWIAGVETQGREPDRIDTHE